MFALIFKMYVKFVNPKNKRYVLHNIKKFCPSAFVEPYIKRNKKGLLKQLGGKKCNFFLLYDRHLNIILCFSVCDRP